jgi:acyl carrier protein
MEQTIKTILGEIIENPNKALEFKSDTNIISDVGLDSLKLINFILKVEEELNIYIDFDSFTHDDLTSIEKFSNFLQKCEQVSNT